MYTPPRSFQPRLSQQRLKASSKSWYRSVILSESTACAAAEEEEEDDEEEEVLEGEGKEEEDLVRVEAIPGGPRRLATMRH